MKVKAASAKCRWIFMTRCITNDVLPKSFQTKPTLKTRRGYALTLEYNKRMLNATRNNAKQQYHDYLKKIEELNNELRATMTADDYNVIETATNTSKKREQIQKREQAPERKV